VVDHAGEWHQTNKFFMHHMMELGTELGSDGFFVGIDNDKIVDVNNRPSQSDKQRTSGEGAPGSPKFSVDCILKNIESCKKASPRIRAKRGVNQTSLFALRTLRAAL
jgi:hypothetical protein